MEYRKMVLVSFLFCFFQSIFFMPLAPITFAGPCPDAMVSYWLLDDISQPYQDSLSSNSGSCSDTCPTAVTGIIGGAQFFDGDASGIDVATTTPFNWNTNDSFSFEFWLQRDDVGLTDLEVIIGRNDAASSLQWWVGINSSGKAEFTLIDQNGSGPSQSLAGNTTLLDGNWHHVVVVRDGASNETRLYVDGTLDSTPQDFTYSTGFQSATAPINIGWLQSGGYHYGGSLDELAIYNGALSDFEVWQHATDGSLGLALGYCYDGTAIRVMPLGDSITRGTSTTIADGNYIVGYRQKLFRTLQEFGYSVDFVGGEQAGSLAFPPFDPNHEGHPGWTATQVANSVYNWLTINPADIVLLHIGTNDVEYTTASQVETILDEIDRYSEEVVVLLARIINRKTYSMATTTLNDSVEVMALTRIANGDRIIMVDQEGALLYPYDFPAGDSIHPTEGGYEKMAIAWFTELESVLPTTNALPVLTFLSEVERFKTTQGQFPLVQNVTLDTLDGVPTSDLTLTSDAIWLDVSVANDTTPTTVTFSVNDNTLPVGVYSTYATASSPGHVDAIIEINLVVVTPNSGYQLLVSSSPDLSNPQFLQNTNLTGDVFIFTSPDAGVSNARFYLDQELHRVENFAPYELEGGSPFNTIQLSSGEHEITAEIKLTTGQTEVISSTFTANGSLPSLTFSTSSIAFTAEEGSLPAGQIVSLGTSDSTMTDFTLLSNVNWLTLSPNEGATPTTVTVSVNDPTLAPGVYNATISAVADGYFNATAAAIYIVNNVGGNGSAYDLLLSTSSDRSGAVTLEGATVYGDIFVFTGPDDGVSGVTFSLDGTVVKTEGLAPYDFAGTAGAEAKPYDSTQLADGLHVISASISLADGGSEVISSTFTATNNIPSLMVDTNSIVFSAQEGVLPAGQTMNLDTSDLTIADHTISSNASWLMVSSSSGMTPAEVTVSITDANLAPGIYNATVTIAADGYIPATVDVSHSVTSSGSFYSLLLSSSSDRSNAVDLEGAIVSGNIYVFTGPDDGVSKVTFYLEGTEVKTEGLVPFDFAGTVVNDMTAKPYDTGQLTNGEHVINASINLSDGSSESISSTFTVSN